MKRKMRKIEKLDNRIKELENEKRSFRLFANSTHLSRAERKKALNKIFELSFKILRLNHKKEMILLEGKNKLKKED